jgi:D-3-phosphoglycerate dehydrogenase
MQPYGENEPGTVLVSPHMFRDLEFERALADEFGLRLVETSDAEEFRAALPDAVVVLLTPYATVGASDFVGMRRCVAVVRYGMGYDNVDVAAATVPVAIVPDAYVEEVATHALAMGLGLLRRLPQGRHAIDAGTWAGQIAYDAPRLSEATVGVIGVGRIGRRVADLWSALGARVIATDPARPADGERFVPLAELLTRSDVVTLHVPLDDSTHHLLSSERLVEMKHGAVLVNVSRGGLVDETALRAALESGRVAGAGLDVFVDEPLPQGHAFEGLANVMLTPHIAWRSDRALGALQKGAVGRARQALLGEPLPDVVNA